MKVIAVPTWGENFRVTSVAFTLGPVAGDRCWNSSTVGGGPLSWGSPQMLPTSALICGVAVSPQIATLELAGTEGRRRPNGS